MKPHLPIIKPVKAAEKSEGHESIRAPLFVSVALSTAGAALLVICATGITTNAGQMSRGALFSGIYLALTLVAGTVSLPFAPRVAHRFGVYRAFASLGSVLSASLIVSGLLIMTGAPDLWVVMLLAPIVGATLAMSGVLATLIFKAFLEPADYPSVMAQMAIWTAIGWGVGALGVGFFLNSGTEGAGLVVAGFLKLPLIVLLSTRASHTAPQAPERPKAALHEIFHALRESPILRRATMMGVVMAIFVAPAMYLTVPIAQTLRHAPLYQGAGFLMAGFALGELLTPQIVKRLGKGGSRIHQTALAALCVAVMLIILGIVSYFFSYRVELALWVIVSVGIAAFRFTSRVLSRSAVAESRGATNSASSLTAAAFVVSLTAPIGPLAWSAGLAFVGAEATAIIAGVAVAIVSALLLRISRSDAPNKQLWRSLNN